MNAMEVTVPGSTPSPKIDIRKQNEGGYNVAWHFSLPTLGRYEYKAGKPEATNCDEPEGYLQEVNEVQFPASELPLKLCTQVFDMAGQGSLPRSDLLEAS